MSDDYAWFEDNRGDIVVFGKESLVIEYLSDYFDCEYVAFADYYDRRGVAPGGKEGNRKPVEVQHNNHPVTDVDKRYAWDFNKTNVNIEDYLRKRNYETHEREL